MARRSLPAPERRQQILDAALEVFAAEGYGAARIEDVAARAGIAKGTVYLHFKDKQDLFEQLVIRLAQPILARAASDAVAEMPARVVLTTLFTLFRREVLGTSRKEIVRLVLAEGRRFPELAAFYHREVVTRGLVLIGGVLAAAARRGELRVPAIAATPHLVVAPLIMSLIWDGLFGAIAPLDLDSLFANHLDLLLVPEEKP
jgi:AcrR family transcriptional regulator